MALQLALTTLESLAEMLNERKREAEQYAAFRDKMRSISSGKFASATRSVLMSSTTTSSGINTLNSSNTNHILDNGPSSLSHLTLDRTSSGGCSGSGPSSLNSLGGNGGLSQPAGPPLRFLLREDNVTQLEFNSAGMVARSKQRRLLLLNDLLVCVSVAGRNSEVDFASTISTAANERLTLKWAVPVGDVELVDGTAGGTLARLLSAGSVSSHGSSHGHGDHHMGPNYGGGRKRTSLTRSLTPSSFIIGSSNNPSVNISSTSASASNSSPYSQNIHENGNGQQGEAENLAQDMNDLMHDFDVVSRMSSMIGSLRGVYEVHFGRCLEN
jgi:Rho guanine nucleotide exchange factor 10